MSNDAFDAVNDSVNKVGAPTQYTKEVGDYICDQLADGKSLLSICKGTFNGKPLPVKTTVYRWLLATHNEELDEFRTNYALAREIQYQSMSDEIMDIADDGTNDYVIANSEEGEFCRVNPEAIGRSRLRVETRKWVMSKVLPKFKDKPENNTSESLAAALQSLIDKLPN